MIPNYEKLNQSDQVYIYFPVKKVRLSSKLTSFWKGPFRITEKISDLLYKVDCGYGGSIQIIHIDRIKKAKEQVLKGEQEIEQNQNIQNVDDVYCEE
jgi:hypothetical protein